MKKLETNIEGLLLIEPRVFRDERGYFYESFSTEKMAAIGLNETFVQDNESLSQKGVIRGLHFQAPPYDQGKLVRVIFGEVFDVAVDIRKNSATYGQWVAETLSSKNKKQLWIPTGFAHGFLTLTDGAEFLYKTTEFYSKKHERCIHWKNNDFDISWPLLNESIVTSLNDA